MPGPKRSFIPFVLLCLAILVPTPLCADQVRDDRWKQDISYFAAELPKRHGNLFALIQRQDFESAVQDLSNAVPNLTDAEIIAGLARLTAMAGDSHTTLSLTQTQTGFRAYPVTLRWFEDGLFVIAAAPEYRRALAARVLRIGDRTADEAYRAVAPFISHENDSWLRVISARYLVLAEVLQTLEIATGAAVPFLFEDASGARFTMDLEVRPGAVQESATAAPGWAPPYLRNVSRPYWFVYIETLRTLYFKYNQCRNASDDPFAAFTARLFSTFDANRVERLIVDLRDNGGGDSSVINPFVNGLQARLATFGNPTRLYVLFNGATYSSAMLNANEFRTGRDAALAAGLITPGLLTLLGEPTGGNPTAPWRNGDTFSLPNSRLSVSHTLVSVPTQFRAGAAVDPDILIPLHSSDWFTRHDPVLAAVLAGGNLRPRPPNSAIAVLNSAGFRGTSVAPGSLASAFGDFSGVDSGDAAALPLSSTIGDTRLLVNDIPAPLLAVRSAQVNFQVPAATPAGVAQVRVVKGGNTVASGVFVVEPAAPGLFTAGAPHPARPGAILIQDGRLNTQDTPARPGEIVSIFATGQGATNPAAADGAPGSTNPPAQSAVAPDVYIGASPAEVIFSGLSPEFPGLWQLNVRVPADADVVAGRAPVFVSAGAVVSNPVTLWIAR